MCVVVRLGVSRPAKTSCSRHLQHRRTPSCRHSSGCDHEKRVQTAAIAAPDLLLQSVVTMLACVLISAAPASAAEFTYVDPTITADFSPQLNPAIAVAAAAAATPPILFWGRIFLANVRRLAEEQRKKQEEERKKQDREELKKKLFGDKR